MTFSTNFLNKRWFLPCLLRLLLICLSCPANSLSLSDHKVYDSRTQQQEILNTFRTEGYVVVDHVSNKQDREQLAKLIRKQAKIYPQARKSGFFDLYHDDAYAQVRQNPALYNTFANLWNKTDLWVVFDRVIYMDEIDRAEKLPLHVDQNPHQHPDFSFTQGLLALNDINEETGMLAVLPRSHLWFDHYKAWSDQKQGWIGYGGDDESDRWKQLRAVPLKEGEMVIWDSRLTHSRANSTAEPGKSKERMLAMISFQPASTNKTLKQARLEAYKKGSAGFNHDAALRHTAGGWEGSLRLNPEHLSPLGEKLYGITDW